MRLKIETFFHVYVIVLVVLLFEAVWATAQPVATNTPAEKATSATIANITRHPNITTETNIGITYDTTTDKVRLALKILEEIYRHHPMTADLIISLNKFADSSLNILVVHWWNATDGKAHLAVMQELNLGIKKRFDEAGIEFAYPSQTHYVKQVG